MNNVEKFDMLNSDEGQKLNIDWIVTVRQAKPDFMSVTEGIKGDALKFGFFIMREFFPKLEKGQSDGYRQNN